MPDLLTHYASSVLVARTRLGLKESLLLGLVGLLPDIDVLLRVHRWATHSLILAITVATPLLALTYRYGRSHFRAAVLAATIYLLHLVLDLFTGPTPILYPLADSLYIKLEVNGIYNDTGIALAPRVTMETWKPDFTPQPAVEGPIASESGIILAVVTTLVLVLNYLGEKKHAKR
jgi:membrane-bound metal-dependent hydrolase YbcI (DUF457 family)